MGAQTLNTFVITPAILAASEPLVSLRLCEVRLQADARWPWIVLVPRREGAREIEDMPADDRALLIEEAMLAAAAVRAIGRAMERPVEKINLGALGNITPQLHLHVVGRRADDAAWPGPVWGAGVAVGYDEAALIQSKAAALGVLGAGGP